jgi:hypothetical protein
MATVFGVNKTLIDLHTGSNLLDQGINKSKICYMQDEYEAAALPNLDVIEVCDKLPDGAVITKLTVLTDDLTGTATIDIGDQDDPARYGNDIDCSGQALTHVFPQQALAADIANQGYQVIEDVSDQIQILVNTAAITGTIKIAVEFAI